MLSGNDKVLCFLPTLTGLREVGGLFFLIDGAIQEGTEAALTVKSELRGVERC